MSVAAGICLSLLTATPSWAQGRTAYVMRTDTGQLLTLDTASPNVPLASAPITGVSAGETLVDLDIRPVNGMLYSLGVNGSADTMTLYLVSHRTGVATPVGAGGFTGAGNLPEPAVSRYGIDFDPARDELRVTTMLSGPGPGIPGLNFRIDPNTGTLIQADTDINPASETIESIAYTNNGLASTVTSLYTLALGKLRIQNPPDSGTQTQLVNTSADLMFIHGFDLDADAVAPASGMPVGGGSSEAYALATQAAPAPIGLFRINLLTGQVGPKLPIDGGTNIPLRGLAVQPFEFGEIPAFALKADGQSLLRFSTASSATVTEAIIDAGIVAGDLLVGIDFRPQTGQLYALGFNSTNNTVQAYLVDPWTNVGGTTASVTAIGAPVALTLPGATAFGFDFNPAIDRIRVISDADENLLLDPNTGALTLADTAINPGGAVVTGAAYTNNYGQDLGAGLPTTLYTLDGVNGQLAIQQPAGGTQTEFHMLTAPPGGPPFHPFTVGGFDIGGNIQTSSANAAVSGQAYAVLFALGSTRLIGIELSTGGASHIGFVGTGAVAVSGFALGDGALRAPTTTAVAASPTSPSVITSVVTFTATVTPANASGTVAFSLNGSAISGCTAQPLTAGTATCQMTFSNTGTFHIVATYSGSDAHTPSTSALLSHSVNKVPTTTTLTVTPAIARVGDPITMTATVAPAGATGTVAFSVNGDEVAFVALTGGQATFTTSSLTVGSYEVAATYIGSLTHSGSGTAAPFVLTVRPSFRQHFAEGATGSFFHTDIGMLNASATAANVTVQLFPENLPALTFQFTLDPLARRSLNLNDILAEQNIAGAVSTSIESDQPIAATRQMTWGTPVYGSTLESGVPDTGTAWYFAEGATNPYSLYYLIENPGAAEAEVTFTHLLEGGAPPIVWNATVAPFARRTVFINEVPGAGNASLSTAIASNVPIVAERAMYLNTTSRQWEGGTASAGATALSTTWSLAEGATGFFYTYLLLGNPNAGAATVTVRYQLPAGTTIEKVYEVNGRSRRTIDVRGEAPQLESATIGMTITSTLPIVAERVMWWGLPFYEGSVALGSTVTGEAWAIGEGFEGGTNNDSTFVLVSNGSANDATVRFTVIYDDGTTQPKDFALAGDGRLTVRIGTDFPASQGRAFSVLVESVTVGVPITVEYSRYQNSGANLLDGGGAALATRVR